MSIPTGLPLLRRLLTPLTAGLALTITAGLAPAQADAAPWLTVSLADPAGQPLVAGAWAELSWQGQVQANEGRSYREWEAFVSLNGGETYPYRITPHLDLSVTHLAVPLPSLPSDDVRLLLRFGDGEVETGYEVARRLQIVPSQRALPPIPLPALARGEAARPGDEGVASWVVGSSRGAGLVVISANLGGLRQRGREVAAERSADVVAEESETAPSPFGAAGIPATRPREERTDHPTAPPPSPTTSSGATILLQTRRRNE